MRRLIGCVGIVGFLVLGSVDRADAQFSLPTVTVTDCSSPFVNISTTQAGATLGFDIDVAFESSVVAVAGVTLGDLTSDCDSAYNDTLPDIVKISIACTAEKSGPGTIATIQFKPVAEGSTDLTFAKCDLDEQPCPGVTSGSLSVAGCPTVDLSNGGSGAFGRSPGRACLVGSLDPDGSAVASTQTVVGFNSSSLAIETCSINPTLTGLGKSLSRTVLGAGSERITVSGGVNPIPIGHLFICQFTIASAVTGPFTLTNASMATSTGGTALPTNGQNGSIGVTSCVGDCNGSGSVPIGEVVKALNAFGNNYLCNATDPSTSCPAADSNNSGGVQIGEVVQTLNQFGAGACP